MKCSPLLYGLFIALLIVTSACERGTSPESEALLDEMNQALESVRRKLGGNEIDSLASQEVEKLFVFEYKVLELEADDTAEALNAHLTELGLERWDCFHIEEREEKIRLYCKRRPKTYLRYIPRVF